MTRTHPGHRFPQGLGLGLTIAQDLITAHSGRLEVESEPGQGSHFIIWLPLQVDDDSKSLDNQPRPADNPPSSSQAVAFDSSPSKTT